MMHGDLSNDVAPRVIVALDEVITPEVRIKKTLGLFPRVVDSWKWDIKILNALFIWSMRLGVNLELAIIEREDSPDRLEDDLDRLGVNPFRWIASYEDVEDLINTLPYQRDLYGVLDTTRTSRYGQYAIEDLP